ncbi:hypothetical protein CORMATOL_01633 [Corynebacterium matruchotii ATCC 33806]|uniref:Uncharacterized protein n=1 Tax=Corynebacterium matruchotii ATCC 33806 TaxID=566549 RepID=C0E3R8_9CORY|nr:hypothetical protein CORMATOL_01633 [Corynebacterium matruchotii ATCC 33806]
MQQLLGLIPAKAGNVSSGVYLTEHSRIESQQNRESCGRPLVYKV